MTYKQAMDILAKSNPVRRPDWITRLVPHPEKGGKVPCWELPAELHEEYPDRVYEPHKTDLLATDWVRA